MSQTLLSGSTMPTQSTRPVPASIPDRPIRRRGRIVLVACVLVALFKLWIVHADEIVARNAPLDDVWYLNSAKFWYWNRPYDQLAFVRPPGYPLFIALTHLTGLPLRVSTELFFLLGAGCFAGALVRAGQGR